MAQASPSDSLFYLCGRPEHEGDLLATGEEDVLEIYTPDAGIPARISDFVQQHSTYVFAVFSYDLRHSIEPGGDVRADRMGAPLVRLVVPRHIARRRQQHWEVLKGEGAQLKPWIDRFESSENTLSPGILLAPSHTREQYLRDVRSLLQHIQRGDIYEINYCIEWAAEATLTDPAGLFKRLQKRAAAPLAAYVSWGPFHLLCASPERFLKKTGDQLISQPIKGTMRRGENRAEDEQLKKMLLEHPKERSENIMITDLVRNDLSRVARRGSVVVDELCGVYTYPTVHQMISTVRCTLDDRADFAAILRATFPMGSMTGAPKIRAMELINQHEPQARGIYSGSIGYFTPEGDFDLNVVIRTVFCNHAIPRISCWAGSAITAGCDPEKEYEECLLKSSALRELLFGSTLQP